jgi:hypothetical protein
MVPKQRSTELKAIGKVPIRYMSDLVSRNTHCFFSYLMVITVQWGSALTDKSIPFLISFSNTPALTAMHQGTYKATTIIAKEVTNSKFYLYNSSDATNIFIFWIGIGS